MSDIQGLLNKYKGIPDERFFGEVFSLEEYKSVKGVKADVVIDIGALAGEFCAYVYDKANVIYAIEPYDPHYEELVNNIDQFGLDKIKPFNIAISDTNEMGYLDIRTRGGHSLGNSGQPIERMTLATFIINNKINHIDVLKIDVEGEENKIFASKDFLTVQDRISFIIGEHLEANKSFFTSLGFKTKTENNNYIYYR